MPTKTKSSKVSKNLAFPTTGKLGINEHGLNLKQERFCTYYVRHKESRGNATLSYAYAYNIDLNRLSDKPSKAKEGNRVGLSPRARAEKTCGVNGSRLLGNARILSRNMKLWNDFMQEEVVDAELMKTILQDEELQTKIAGIREYNKLKKRITKQIGFKRPLEDMSDEELMEAKRELVKQLMKK